MALLKPDEISSIIRNKIENYEAQTEISNIGSVLEVGDGIARIYGLRNVMAGELVEFQDGKGTLGMTLILHIRTFIQLVHRPQQALPTPSTH